MKRILVLLFACMPAVVMAGSFGEVADNIFGPVELVTQLMLGVCYIGGALLTVFGLLQYKTHRQNPKMVPITTVLLLTMSGLVLLALPHISTKQGWSWAATVTSKSGNQAGNFAQPPTVYVPPAPSVTPNMQDHTDSEGPELQPQMQPGVPATPEPATPSATTQQIQVQPQQPSPKVYIDTDEPR